MFRLHPSVALLALLVVGCQNSSPEPTKTGDTKTGTAGGASAELTKLGTEDTKVGTGAPVKANDKVYV
ncbi:hypothetical protein EON81_21745, partial [bacterium]